MLSPIAAQGRGDRGLRGGPGARRRRATDPRLGQHAARRPDARRRSPTPSPPPKELRPRAAAHPRSLDQGTRRDALAELGCGGILGVGDGSDAPPRLVELTYSPKGAKHAPRAGRQGHHLRLGRPDHQARREHGRDEVRHGRRRRASSQATFAIAQLGLPIKVTTFAPMAENMVSGSSFRPGDVLTMYGGTTVEVAQHRRRGPAACSPTRWCAPPRRSPTSIARRRHPDRPHGRRPRRPGRRRDGLRGRSSTTCSPPAAAPARQHWPMPIPEEMAERIHSQQDRRPAPARLGALGRRPLRRRRSCASSPPACRGRTSTSPARRSTPAAPYGHVTSGGTGFGVTTLVEYARALADAELRPLGDSSR